jgi:polysaccharide biosynthesis/export protein
MPVAKRSAVLPIAAIWIAASVACGQDTGAKGEPQSGTNYVLGPDDQIALLVPDADELNNKAFRINRMGDVDLPVIGRTHAAGLTAEQLEGEIDERLKRFLVDPKAVVAVTDFRSQPISILGAVNTPGVHQVQGQKTLYEALSLAGGLREDAGNIVKITRKLKWGPIPLANAKTDPTGQFSIASVPIKEILQASNPAANIAIAPEDVISVPKAELVYVIGSVHKPGGFTLGENTSFSALQVLSLAEGLDSTAAGAKAKIMRVGAGGLARLEIPINLKSILAGKSADVELRANDILFVPNSLAKSTAVRTLETAIGMGGQIGAGLAIYK